jgi:hypothetical protein
MLEDDVVYDAILHYIITDYSQKPTYAVLQSNITFYNNSDSKTAFIIAEKMAYSPWTGDSPQ